VLPADERLDAGNAPTLQLGLGLVMQKELFLVDRPPQLGAAS